MQQATLPARILGWCTRKMQSAWARARKSGSSCSLSAPCCRPRFSQELLLPSCAALHSAEMATILTPPAPVPGFFSKQPLAAWVCPRDGAWLETDDGLQTIRSWHTSRPVHASVPASSSSSPPTPPPPPQRYHHCNSTCQTEMHSCGIETATHHRCATC